MSDPNSSADAFFALYRYTPSLEAAILAGTLFGVVTVFHFFKLMQTKSFYFIPFTIGGLFETIGYYGRIWSHFDQYAIGGYVIQSLLILVAPALFAATVYMILGRVIRALKAESHSLIRVDWLTKIFVVGDVISFCLQGGGGGIQAAGTLDLYHLGEKIIIIGLFVQIIFFGFFIVSTIVFHRRVSANPTEYARDGAVPWRSHLWVLYGVSTLIMVRSVFRVVEYLQGNAGYIVRREFLLYIFDAVLMYLVLAMFAVNYVDGLNATRYRKASIISMERVV
ncbi:RTA1 like protein-domain-containing protein [Xylariomycetidae sp. FL0641]|nr:RTA1 like protein-domain-containing protein [Xylariomycetidae sp. FL0641]